MITKKGGFGLRSREIGTISDDFFVSHGLSNYMKCLAFRFNGAELKHFEKVCVNYY